jgi:iron complex outermembrane recepter protein
MTLRSTLLKTSAACALALSVVLPAAAQNLAIEEITVTSRKRAENIQDIPLSIAAFSVDQLRDRGIDNIHELAEQTAGFAMDRGFGRFFDRPVIRGQSSILGGRNASFFIDGVYVSGSIASTTIDSLERIEVLRGPQSALYGRATFAGAINYITKRPANEFEGQFNGRYGSHNDFKSSLWLSGPVVEDKLFYFVAGNWDYYGGEWKNDLARKPLEPRLFPGGPILIDGPDRGDQSRLGDEESQDVSLKLLFTPSETVEFTLKGAYSTVDDGHYARTLVGRSEHNCFEPVAGTPTKNSMGYVCGEIEARDPTTGKPRVARLNIPDLTDGISAFFTRNTVPGVKPGLQRDTYNLLAETKVDMNDWEVTLRGAYNKQNEKSAFDGDSVPIRGASGFVTSASEDPIRDYSVELRVASPGENALRGQAGLYYYDELDKSRARTFSIFPTVFAADGSDFNRNTIENIGVFAQLEYDFTDDLTVSIEGRYAEDKIGTLGSTGLNASGKFKSFTPRVTVDYQLNDDSLVYALVAKGNKPGGYNTVFFGNDISEASRAVGIAAGQDTVDEETAWTYEVGSKNTLWDGRATLNVSAYYIDWSNQQLTEIIQITNANNVATTATVLVNLGATEIYGGEVEATVAATENLNLSLAYGLADSKILKFNDEDVALLTGVDDLTGDGNAAGNQLPKQPKHTLTLSSTYRDELSADADWFARADLAIESKRWTEVGNFSHTGDIWRLNLRMGIDADNWKITGYINNALNDLTANNILRFRDYTAGFSPSGARWRGFFFNQPRGRDFGVDVQYSF